MLDIFRRRPVAPSSEEIEAVTAEAEAATEAQSEQELEPEHAAGTSSRSSYQRLASSSEEIDALRAAVCTLQAEMSALKGPQPSTSASYDNLQEETNSTLARRSGHSEGPPLLPLCVGGGCIQDASAELSNSVYFISLLRVVSLLKATRVSRTCPTSEAPANARPRLAAAGWATLLLVAALCQIFLMVLILETSTSSTCNFEEQSGCRSGEYCSFSIAKGQCNDCSVILPNTSPIWPKLDAWCVSDSHLVENKRYVSEVSGICDSSCPENRDTCDEVLTQTPSEVGCPYICKMYEHCISKEVDGAEETKPWRCDFLVNGRSGVKWSHILLLIFGAVLWASDLISVLDETDMIAATVLKAATGEERNTHSAIVMLFRFIFVFRTCALPALTATGAIVAILTDEDGGSLTGGAPTMVEPVIVFRPLISFARPPLRFPQVSLSCSRSSCSALLRIWTRRSARSLRDQQL